MSKGLTCIFPGGIWIGYYIRADGSTLAGMTMRSQDWVSATSIPPLINDGICSV